MTVVLALLASLGIGVSDFLGARASRGRHPLHVTALLHLGALAVLGTIALVRGGDPAWSDVALGAGSGVITGASYVVFFAATARGRLSIVVPVSAALAAITPTASGVLDGARLSLVAAAGIVLALAAIPLVAYEPAPPLPGERRVRVQVALSVLCGTGFGTFFVAVGHTPASAGLWPTVANLVAGLVVVCLLAASAGVLAPRRPSWLALASGATLGVADATLTVALQHGPLTVASVLGNLYPVVTVALGVALLRERLRPWHAVGIGCAVGGVAAIAGG